MVVVVAVDGAAREGKGRKGKGREDMIWQDRNQMWEWKVWLEARVVKSDGGRKNVMRMQDGKIYPTDDGEDEWWETELG